MAPRASNRFAILCILPAVVLLAAIFLMPLWGVIVQSLHADDGSFTLAGYRALVGNALVEKVLWSTLSVSVLTTLVALLVGYPVAYHLSRQPPRRRAYLMILVLLPFWTSILVKTFAFTVIFGGNNPINVALATLLGYGPGATPFLFNRTGVVIGLTQFVVPFMVFPILTSLLVQEPDLARAAEIMGSGRTRIFWRITFPLSFPGVAAGSLLVFILAFGSFITPALLGGRKEMMIGNLISFYIHDVLDWTLASAMAVVLLVLSLALGLGLTLLPGGAATAHGGR